MARLSGDRVELRCGDRTVLEAPRQLVVNSDTGPRLLHEAQERGWKIRPRALTTTVFWRLFVADVFVHGIGGAKYDLITDEVVRRFFRVEPPRYIVCSATVRLPVPTHGATAEDLRREKWLLRDLTYNPDRHLAEAQRRAQPYRPLIGRKWALIGQPRGETPAARRETFLNIRAANASLMNGLADRAAAVRRRIPEVERQIAADAVLASREYAFCLFPAGVLPAFYDRALAELKA